MNDHRHTETEWNLQFNLGQPYLKQYTECLEKVQRRATKMVKRFKKLSYKDRLTRMGLTSLADKCLSGDLIET